MEGWKNWIKCVLVLVGGAGLIIVASPSTVDAFFIRGAKPPPIKQNQGPPVVVPAQQSGGGSMIPPPPVGEGFAPPSFIDPPVEIAQATPEPTSLVTALLGAGVTFGYAWRRRRKNRTV